MPFLAYSFSGPSADSAVLHDSEESYTAAIASGHRDTYAPEAWEGSNDPADEREALRSALRDAGVTFGPNTGLAKLREMVAALPPKE